MNVLSVVRVGSAKTPLDGLEPYVERQAFVPRLGQRDFGVVPGDSEAVRLSIEELEVPGPGIGLLALLMRGSSFRPGVLEGLGQDGFGLPGEGLAAV
jgi:hypothetical protein